MKWKSLKTQTSSGTLCFPMANRYFWLINWGKRVIFKWREIHHLHLAVEKTEAPGSDISCPKSRSYKVCGASTSVTPELSNVLLLPDTTVCAELQTSTQMAFRLLLFVVQGGEGANVCLWLYCASVYAHACECVCAWVWIWVYMRVCVCVWALVWM